TRGFALSLGCGEHYWLDHIRGRKMLLLPLVALQYPLQRDKPHEDFYRPCRHIRIVLLPLVAVVTEHYFL
ncbi:hypothetical protein J8956_28035, partial [Klebsiella pneumoniae]